MGCIVRQVLSTPRCGSGPAPPLAPHDPSPPHQPCPPSSWSIANRARGGGEKREGEGAREGLGLEGRKVLQLQWMDGGGEPSKGQLVKNLLMPLFLMGCFPVDFQEVKRPLRTESVKRPIKVGKRPINEGKRPIKAKVLVGVSVGSLMGCFRAPPPWRKTAPLKRPMNSSMSWGQTRSRGALEIFVLTAVRTATTVLSQERLAIRKFWERARNW